MLGVGLGYRPEEDRAFGVPDKRMRHYEDKLAVTRALLDGEPVTASGPGYELENAVISMRLEPRPQLHIGVISEPGARRAGRYGDGWVASTTVPLREIAALDAAFREPHGGPGVELPALRDVVVRGTDEEARAIAKPFLDPPPPPPGSSPAFKPDVDVEGAYLIGSPETVIAKIREHAAVGVDHFIFRPQRPGVSLPEAKETLRILASDVLPAFR